MRNHTSTALILQTNPGQIWKLASLALFCALFATACAIENPRSNQARALGEVAVASALPALNVCIVPDPKVPSSAIDDEALVLIKERMGL